MLASRGDGDMDFSEVGLSQKLRKGVEAAGYTTMFPIQQRAIGPLLAGRNVVAQAQTGSGKTAAFGLPLLQRVEPANGVVQALVLAPTRELSQQIARELKKLGKYTEAKVLAIFGGQSINVQLEELRRGVHVVVGTPGRIIDHLRRRTLDLSRAAFVVLDEADRMLDMGFRDDVDYILEHTPAVKQLALFSATMPEGVVRLTEEYMPKAEKILVDTAEPSVESLDQYYTVAKKEEKLQALLSLLEKEGASAAIVFCRTKEDARRLARDLEKRYLSVVSLHGDLSQAQRDQSMELFRSGRVDVLVATDVASRGLDIATVGCVFNYNVPDDPLIYFHRVGRTARAGQAGRSYTLVSPEEFADFARILEMTKARIKPTKPEDEEYSIEVGPHDFSTRHRGGIHHAGPSQRRFRQSQKRRRRAR